MPLGKFSLDTRVQLAKRAEVSLDVQYYHFENDETGRWLLRSLRDAANRGVRVRLLIDDFYTAGADEISSPSPHTKTWRCASSIRSATCAAPGKACASCRRGDWKRVNHRMHNKLFIADGAMAVIGGRNVANEYFLRASRRQLHRRRRLHRRLGAAAAAGPVRPLLERRRRVPDPAVTRSPLDPEALREYFEKWTGPEMTPPPEPLPATDILGYGPIPKTSRTAGSD